VVPLEDDWLVRFLGRIQPYSIYVPDSYSPPGSVPLTLYLHGSGQNHLGQPTNVLRQLGEQRGAILHMPLGRGPLIPWRDESELDTFEDLGDVLARYNVDLDRMTVSGYSMGDHGTH
jgi:predicted peptidase